MSAQKADIPFSVARRKVMQTKILVADDQPGLRFLLSEALSGQGYEVITIESREHIFEVLEKEQPALILMDRHMPGEEFFAWLADPHTEKWHHKTILLSGAVRPEEKQILEKQGLRVMFKPFDLFELLELVETVLDESSKKPEVAANQPE